MADIKESLAVVEEDEDPIPEDEKRKKPPRTRPQSGSRA
jgi:hypothetical protein